MSVTARLTATLAGTHINTLDLGTATETFSLAATHAFTSGTGSGMVDKEFSDTRTLAASATEDLDLTGTLLDALGATLTIAKLKAVMITAASGNTNNVVLTRPASNGCPLFEAAGDGIAIKPGGTFIWVAPGTGVTVTAGTGDLLTLTNSGAGTGVTYSIVLLGTSV